MKLKKNDWGFVVKSNGQCELAVPKKKKFSHKEIIGVTSATVHLLEAQLSLLRHALSTNKKA